MTWCEKVIGSSPNARFVCRALHLHEWLLSLGHLPDDRLCTTLMRVCSQHSHFAESLSLYEWMRTPRHEGGAGLKPSVFTYTGAMRAALVGNLPDRALQVLYFCYIYYHYHIFFDFIHFFSPSFSHSWLSENLFIRRCNWRYNPCCRIYLFATSTDWWDMKSLMKMRIHNKISRSGRKVHISRKRALFSSPHRLLKGTNSLLMLSHGTSLCQHAIDIDTYHTTKSKHKMHFWAEKSRKPYNIMILFTSQTSSQMKSAVFTS